MKRDELKAAEILLYEVDQLAAFSCSGYTGLPGSMAYLGGAIVEAMCDAGKREAEGVRLEKVKQLRDLGVEVE